MMTHNIFMFVFLDESAQLTSPPMVKSSGKTDSNKMTIPLVAFKANGITTKIRATARRAHANTDTNVMSCGREFTKSASLRLHSRVLKLLVQAR